MKRISKSNPCVAETAVFQENLIDTMAADVLATPGARTSEVMVLTILEKCVIVFHKDGFQLPLCSYEMQQIFINFLNKNGASQELTQRALALHIYISE